MRPPQLRYGMTRVEFVDVLCHEEVLGAFARIRRLERLQLSVLDLDTDEHERRLAIWLDELRRLPSRLRRVLDLKVEGRRGESELPFHGVISQ